MKKSNHTVTLVFENTDSISFNTGNEVMITPFVIISDVTKSYTIRPVDGILTTLSAKEIYLSVSRMNLTSPHSEFYNNGWVTSKDSDEYDAWQMLKEYRGISAIIIDEDKDSDMIYVPWSERSETENLFEVIELGENPDELSISIKER
ncbi:hypothetical protein RND61_15450 [Streptomyces sp. TRM76323]|uniref:Uncharacterized protein n=1 Tax=Streptomyces tamarix TaxID=3078565 RepID=A0ABU3QLW4_9ACTN|nr:hypothetical protein [Streptomyces tamarix]MDT9683443.1 hypothetical protein [Streptomyces tamarix]